MLHSIRTRVYTRYSEWLCTNPGSRLFDSMELGADEEIGTLERRTCDQLDQALDPERR